MDFMSFTFGILAVMGLLFIVALIVGLVKVSKHERKLKEIEASICENIEHLHRCVEATNNELVSQTSRVENNIMNEIERIDRNVDGTRSYIDSRIDKLNK